MTKSNKRERKKAMPIKPKPFTYVCHCCGWKKTVAPTSDASFYGDGECFDSCPKCGHPELERREPGVIDVVLVKLFQKVLQR
jgi:hypothetical protein